MSRFPRPSRPFAAVLAFALASSGLAVIPAVAASADSAPPDPTATPTTVSSDALPAPQINGVVWDQEIVGDTVFVAGNFSTARPAGVAAGGAGTVTRTSLLSYSLSTGELTSWAPALNGQVDALDASPDGSRIYAVGAFTTVNGATRNRIVAFDTATGTVISSFAGSANGEVFAVDSTNSTVYFAGNFSQSNGVSRPGRAAAASAATGATTAWAPVLASGRAYGIVVSPDESKVVIGGSFTTLNGSNNPGYGLGMVTATTGASLPFATNSIVRSAGDNAAIYSLNKDGDSIYGTGYVFGAGGNLEGTFRADWDGNLQWVEDCHGDTYSAAAANGVVYTTSHAHFCGNVGGFPQQNPWVNTRAVAFTKATTSTLTRESLGYYNWAGTPAPSMLNWFPSINAGTFTGAAQGAWSVTANSDYVLYGGEFTTVNGQAQQGLVRFAVPGKSTNADGPRVSSGTWPISVASTAAGTATVSWPSNWDRDNSSLVYRVIRDGVSGTPVRTVTGQSNWYTRPGMSFTDTGLAPGSSHSYKVTATDPFGNVATSQSVSVTVAAAGARSPYAEGVIADSPTWYYRMGGTGTALGNSVGPIANTTSSGTVTQAVGATIGSGAVRGVTGAIAGDADTATRFVGANSSRAYSAATTWVDGATSVEAWIKTTASSGKIVGFGNSTSASNSGTYDRHLYMNGGRILWGLSDGTQRVLQSAAGFNDGAWHYVVGTVGPAGQTLYVDGKAVASDSSTVRGARYWATVHIGGDATWAGNQNFSGDIDEVAIYRTPLSADAVARHYQLGIGGIPANAAPTAAFTAATTNLTVAVDGSTSSDSDGSITAYTWDFGDGVTGSGATATHAYATGGTYIVRLTVRDDDGATGTTTRSVTVTAPPADPTIARDSFARTSTSGWGAADLGGAWTVSGSAANYTVAAGAGTFLTNAGSTRHATLNGVTSVSTDAVVSITLDKAATGGGTVAGIVGRQVGADFYQARIRYLASGATQLELLSGGATLLTWAALPGVTAAPGQQLMLRVQVTGTSPTTIRARAWPADTAEPTTWAASITDSTPALQTAGAVGLEGYVSGSATNAPISIRFSSFAAATP